MKQLLALVTLLGTTTIAFTQGQVFFSGGVTDATKVSTNPLVPSAGWISGPVGTWQFAMFSAPTNFSSALAPPWLDPNWSFTGNYATNTGSPGRYAGGYNADGSVSVPGYSAGSYVHLLLIGWDTATGGFDLNSVINAYNGAALRFYGRSGIAEVLLGDGVSPPNSLLNMPGFVLIPEPGSITLFCLGTAALLRLRGRKSRGEPAN